MCKNNGLTLPVEQVILDLALVACREGIIIKNIVLDIEDFTRLQKETKCTDNLMHLNGPIHKIQVKGE